MARPQKEGLDYFSVDCYFSDSVKFIGAEFGLIGYGCIVRIWQKIYGGKGFYTDWNDDVALLFAQENNAGVNVVKEVISACVRRGIFDRDMLTRYGILTSEKIQARYAKATERREPQKIEGRYLLISAPSNWVIDNNNSINDNKNGENVDNNTQSKVKKSKEKESKVKEREDARAETAKEPFGCFENVEMTSEDRDRLVAMFGEEVARELIDNLSRKLKSKGYKYEDHYATILVWAKKDGVKPEAAISSAGGSFDTDEFFKAALARSYKEISN
jgi:hypothetical protein